MLRLSKLPAVIMALTVALSACTEGTDGVGVDDIPFDAEASAGDLVVVQGVFAASVFQSLAFSSQNFGQVAADTLPAPVSLLQASLAAASASSHGEAAAAAQAFATSGPAAGSLLHTDLHGRTYDRNANDVYRHNLDRTDGPATGVRFILYEVDPVTGEAGSTEIGYVDILDESTDLAYVAHVIVVTGGVEHINYTVSAVVGSQSLAFTVSGFISDGTDQVDIDLSMSFVHDLPVRISTVDHLISVPARGFEVDATVVFEFNDETLQGSVDIDATFMQGAHTVSVTGLISFNEGDLPSEGGTFEVSVDGQLFATIVVDGDTRTVQNGTGGELTSDEVRAVRNIFDGLHEMFDEKFEDFIRPVKWLFGD